MIRDITIGSDPEFVFMKQGDVIESYSIISPRRMVLCPKAIPDCDVCGRCTEFCRKKHMSPEIGIDGMLGELRPQPGKNPIEHVNTIHNLIHKLDYLPSDIEIKAGSIQKGYAIGGHIHIGTPILRGKIYGDEEHYIVYHLARFLSHYCGIPLRKIEHPADIKKRGLGYGFGAFGACDSKPYGIEWRMPASWLVSKEIATAALCLAYVVAENYDPEYLPMKMQQYRLTIKYKIPYIIRDIESMEGYDEYKREIDVLLDMIERQELWDTNVNVRDTWK